MMKVTSDWDKVLVSWHHLNLSLGEVDAAWGGNGKRNGGQHAWSLRPGLSDLSPFLFGLLLTQTFSDPC